MRVSPRFVIILFYVVFTLKSRLRFYTSSFQWVTI
jgi:hypothetical protein